MQLKYKRDFFIRNGTFSDQPEVLALVEKHQNSEAAQQLKANFASILNQTPHFFKTLLNSNGVVIGALHASPEQFEILAVNPNFLKQEVKEVILAELKEWSLAHHAGKVKIAPRLISGDWKSFFKQAGVKMEKLSEGTEWLLF